jgi:hypothetical protein
MPLGCRDRQAITPRGRLVSAEWILSRRPKRGRLLSQSSSSTLHRAYLHPQEETAAVRQKLTDSSEHQEIVAGGIRNAVELSDGEEQGLDLDPDIAEDESKPVEHVSKANFGGRFT